MFPTASSERICNSLKRAGMAASHSAKSLRNIRTSTPFTRTRRRERLLCCAAPIPPCVRRPCHAERLTSNASRCRSWITAHSESGLLARRSPSRVGFLWGYPDVERVSMSTPFVAHSWLRVEQLDCSRFNTIASRFRVGRGLSSVCSCKRFKPAHYCFGSYRTTDPEGSITIANWRRISMPNKTCSKSTARTLTDRRRRRSRAKSSITTGTEPVPPQRRTLPRAPRCSA